VLSLMRKYLLVLVVLAICTLPSCTVGISPEVKEEATAIVAQIKRLNDNIEAYRKDTQALTEQLKLVTDRFNIKSKTSP
jgi:outer membrane murein-binding lipoprotein Lpp